MYGTDHDLRVMGPVNVACLFEIAYRLGVPRVGDYVRVRLPHLLWDGWDDHSTLDALAQMVSTAYNDMPDRKNHLRAILVEFVSDLLKTPGNPRHPIGIQPAFASST